MKNSVLRGVNIQVTRSRIADEERDPALFYYETRHGDQVNRVCTVEKNVKVNFYGTVVAEKEIRLDIDEPRIYKDKDGNEHPYQWIGINFDEEKNKHERKSVGTKCYDKDLKPWK